MAKILGLAAVVIVAAIAVLLAYAATRPDIFRVQRSATVQAPPDRVFALINDMRQFNTWNPFNRKDPNMTGTYRGPMVGPGAAYDFSGNNNVGKGSLRIVDATPASRVAMKLDMTAPMEAHNDIEFKLVPAGGSGGDTQVTWSMEGPCPFIGKVMGVIFNMDKMVGGDFESGLASLKALAEKP